MLISTIQSAIQEKKELLLKVKYGVAADGYLEVFMQPYVFGSDVLQYRFIWGYLTHNHTFYKMFIDLVVAAEIIEIPYLAHEDSVYDLPVGEELICVLDGLSINCIEEGTSV